jgi:hypothetical protein
MSPRAWRPRVLLLVGSVLVVLLGVLVGVLVHADRGAPRHTAGSPPSAGPPAGGSGPSGSVSPTGHTPIFAIYYMWWDRQHWLSRLGPAYPVAAGWPLPATVSGDGCGTVNKFAANKETDISPGLRYDQSDPATIDNDVRLAAKAGLDGFVVNWIGTGRPDQTVTSSDYNQRLKYMFDAVHRLDAAGGHFSIMLNYQSSAKKLQVAQFVADLGYFSRTYGNDPVLDHRFSKRVEVVMAGTWKYTDAQVAQISQALRPSFYLIGDEKPSTWDAARETYLDGTSYYWSSQNPAKNPSSFATLEQFAATVRSHPNPDGTPKTWLAPFTPGYNAMLLYGTSTCVPRDNGQTMRTLFEGNARSRPDGWTLISWNEISEGSYVVPLSRYGTAYVDDLAAITQANR